MGQLSGMQQLGSEMFEQELNEDFLSVYKLVVQFRKVCAVYMY